MMVVKILVLLVVLCAAIFMITYAAHEKSGEEGENCNDCSGDCLHCGRSIGNGRGRGE